MLNVQKIEMVEKNGFEPYTKSLKKLRILLLTSNNLNVSIKYIHLQKGDGMVLEVEYFILEYASDSRRE